MFCRVGGLWLGVHFLIFVLVGADLNRAFQHGSVFHADARGNDVARERAFTTDVQTIGALDIPSHFAHDDNFSGADVGNDDSVAPDGDPAVGKIDRALNAAVDI